MRSLAIAWREARMPSRYPPAEPGAFFCEPLEAAWRSLTRPRLSCATLKVARSFPEVHLVDPLILLLLVADIFPSSGSGSRTHPSSLSLYVRLAAHDKESLSDSRICQTSTAFPAEPGEPPFGLGYDKLRVSRLGTILQVVFVPRHGSAPIRLIGMPLLVGNHIARRNLRSKTPPILLACIHAELQRIPETTETECTQENACKFNIICILSSDLYR